MIVNLFKKSDEASSSGTQPAVATSSSTTNGTNTNTTTTTTNNNNINSNSRVRASTRTRNENDPHIGKYRLIKTIGKGNFAKVKLARHELIGKEVILKMDQIME